MTIEQKEKFLQYVEASMAQELMRFSKGALLNGQAEVLAKELVDKIDWNNPALMHKGISWIAKNYINQLFCLKNA